LYWTLVTTGNVIAGFDAMEFNVNVGANAGAAGFSNALGGGVFSVALSGDMTDLVLNFTAIPEPTTGVLLAFGVTAMLASRRRRASVKK